MATLLCRAHCPHVHAQTALLTLLSRLLSHAPVEGSLGEVSKMKPRFRSLLRVALCVCVCVHTRACVQTDRLREKQSNGEARASVL